MKKLVYIFLVMTGGLLRAQTQGITPQVISTAGQHRVGPGGFSVTDNVGEPFTTTMGNSQSLRLTQGFIQPVTYKTPDFSVTPLSTDVSCKDKNDGRISLAITSTIPQNKYTLSYMWTPTLVCPGNNCSELDSLKAGTYSLSVIFTYSTITGDPETQTVTIAPQTITDVNGPCKIRVFSGVTLNGDGINDVLFIENISEFPNNRVSIYNRWGVQLFDKKNYDNVAVSWPTPDEASKLVPSTYFYIIDLGDGGKPVKGWAEVIKN